MIMKKLRIKIALCLDKVKRVLVKISTECFRNTYWVATGTTLWFLVNC